MCKQKLTIIIVIPEFKKHSLHVELQALIVRGTQILPIQN